MSPQIYFQGSHTHHLKKNLQSLRVEAFSVRWGIALATDGVEVSLGAIASMLVETVTRIKFF